MTSEASFPADDEQGTPHDLFAWANRRYGPFDVDTAAARWNAKVRRFFSRQTNALVRSWAVVGRRTRYWNNPPYSTGHKEPFLRHGRSQVLAGDVALGTHLVPHDNGDGYWRRVVTAPAGRFLGVSCEHTEWGVAVQLQWERLTVEIIAIEKRLKFIRQVEQHTSTARHSSALVTFARPGVLRPLVQMSALLHGRAA